MTEQEVYLVVYDANREGALLQEIGSVPECCLPRHLPSTYEEWDTVCSSQCHRVVGRFFSNSDTDRNEYIIRIKTAGGVCPLGRMHCF